MPFDAANRSPALTVLDGLVEFFADGSRWHIGWFSGHDDPKCLVGHPGWSGLRPAFGATGPAATSCAPFPSTTGRTAWLSSATSATASRMCR